MMGMMDMVDFFAQEEEEQTCVENSVTPFMVLWNVLAKWITNEGVQMLRDCRSDLFPDTYIGPVVKELSENHESSTQHLNSSDISLSRCAGLMSMLRLNMSKALSQLGYNER